jgi:hypothetical protein
MAAALIERAQSLDRERSVAPLVAAVCAATRA